MSLFSMPMTMLALLVCGEFQAHQSVSAEVEEVYQHALSEKDPQPALAALENLGQTLAGKTLPNESVERLQALVLDTKAHALVRRATLLLLCRNVPQERGQDVLKTMTVLLGRLPSVEGGPDGEYYAIPALLESFLAEGASALADRLDDQDRLLEFCLETLKNPAIHNEKLRVLACERIADNPASVALRQRTMLHAVRTMQDREAPEQFFDLVDATVVDELRHIAFKGPVGKDGYNAGALRLLAEYGDLKTVTEYKRWAKLRGYEQDLVGRVGGYVWMIEAQHNANMLLDHIKSQHWQNNHTRIWALERAIRIGVAKEAIRTALLEHAKSADGDERLKGSIGHLNHIARSAGVLSAEDLSHVKAESVRVLKNVLFDGGYGPGIGTAVLRVLAASAARIEDRRAAAEAIVAANPRSTELPAILLSLIDASSLPKLRELVRASADAESFHYAAAAALAHWGDREILPDLEAARTMLRAKHVNLEGYVIYYIWQITIQHPVSKLLDFIASTERLPSVETRMWAVRRAVELNIPREKIRQALLKHAKQVEPKVFRDGDGRKVKAWPGLSSLKKQGLKLGILRADDLPRVKMPKVEPMP